MARPAVWILLTTLQAASAIAAPAAPPMSAPPACLDPTKPYHAKWLSGRDVLVAASTGKQRLALRLSTNCISLDAAGRIFVSSTGACLAAGDGVTIRRPGEPAQTCKITGVAPAGAGL
jgi:hypothetical protein